MVHNNSIKLIALCEFLFSIRNLKAAEVQYSLHLQGTSITTCSSAWMDGKVSSDEQRVKGSSDLVQLVWLFNAATITVVMVINVNNKQQAVNNYINEC